MTVTQYHFTSWPDHGVPQYGSPLMMLYKKVMAGWKRGGPPIIVHCSAGVGRTGTFITIDIALEQAEKKGVVDIAGIINRLREQRMLMVQTVVCITIGNVYDNIHNHNTTHCCVHSNSTYFSMMLYWSMLYVGRQRYQVISCHLN